MEEYGMEMMDEMEDDMGQMEMEYGQEMGPDYGDEDEESMNFDGNPEFAHLPPLDKMRKIRRDILRTINEARGAHGSPSIYIDPMATRAAS